MIFPGASVATCTNRRKLYGQEANCAEQLSRLAHARQHANLAVETADRAEEEVLAQHVAFLEGRP